jgi:EmrB/QacA subfamily drug resistance transporter
MRTARQFNRWHAFALLAASYLIATIDMSIVNVSLPTIGRDLHVSPTNLQWVASAYALAFGGFLLAGGRAADLFGRRRVFVLGLGLFTAASLGCALAAGEGWLIAMRGLQGLAAAVMIPAALSIVMNTFTDGGERNKALAIWGAMGAGGATVGLIAGGVITRYLGWHGIFYLNVPIGLIALGLTPLVVPASRVAGSHRRFDLAGAVCGTAGLVLLVDAISQAPRVGWDAPRTVVLVGLALAVLAAFAVIESRTPDPLLPLSIFRLRGVAGANLAGLLLGASFIAFVFTGTLYMQQVLHYSALQTGTAWLTASVTSMLMAPGTLRLVTRFGAGPVLMLGATLIGAGILWATQAPVDGHFLADLAGPFLVCGVGTSLSFTPISVAGLAGVPAHQSGLASGLLSSSNQLGAAVGIAVAASVAASGSRSLLQAHDAVPVALTGGFHQTFWVLGTVALLVPLSTLALIRRPRPVSPTARRSAGAPSTGPALATTR